MVTIIDDPSYNLPLDAANDNPCYRFPLGAILCDPGYRLLLGSSSKDPSYILFLGAVCSNCGYKYLPILAHHLFDPFLILQGIFNKMVSSHI